MILFKYFLVESMFCSTWIWRAYICWFIACFSNNINYYGTYLCYGRQSLHIYILPSLYIELYIFSSKKDSTRKKKFYALFMLYKDKVHLYRNVCELLFVIIFLCYLLYLFYTSSCVCTTTSVLFSSFYYYYCYVISIRKVFIHK